MGVTFTREPLRTAGGTGRSRPLFGRARPLVVPPLNPAEMLDALPSSDAVELFDAYLVTGGYPRLVRSWAAAGVESVGSWWNRDHSVEIDIVTRARTGPLMLGTIKWRPRAGITSQEVAHLAAGRAAAPERARRDCSASVPPAPRTGAEVGLDLVLTAADLIAAWR